MNELSQESLRLTEKQRTLSKYKETVKDQDFELDDNDELDLSYSKFSQASAISRSNTHSQESPFVKKIQHKLNDIRHQNEIRMIGGPSSSSSSGSSNIYPIREILTDNDENIPFKPPNKKITHGLNTPDRITIPKNRGLKKNVTVVSPEATSSTTPIHRHMRNPSVKVSLTPAQRVEKKPGIRLTNALENFQFEEMVGRGAFANVYKGINLKTNQTVAIKQILLEKYQDVQALMGEIDLLKILKHPNIVKYHGFVKTSSSLNVFLEFCAGGSLRQLYKRKNRGLSESNIILFVKLILNGLSYLHEQGVVHRDVKAANVLITETGEIKLADFGVATKVTDQHQSVVGTPNWMAPETILGGEGLCTASDIWSLGATIIELFTTNPPYHDLNPMATLHAIGTDDYPPLPKNISLMAKDFLLECFQKQPSLRKTAKLLLKHKWLNQEITQKREHKNHVVQELTSPNNINIYSENYEEDWEKDFSEIKIHNPTNGNNLNHNIISPSNSGMVKEDISLLSKAEKLNKFSEGIEEEHIDDFIINNGTKPNNHDYKIKLETNDSFEVTDDPFLNIEIDNFDTNELEIQSKMEFLITKFSKRVDLSASGNEEVLNSLVKITGKIAHLVKKYPVLHDVLIRDHGIVSFFELLENSNDLPIIPKLWYYSIVTLNYIFEKNLNQFENFCLLGGIPIITQFRSNKYDEAIKLQVVKFIRLFSKSDRALTMFISCGGLRVLSKFAEEDFDINPQFSITSINLIHIILTKDLSGSKSNICRKLSHYGVIFWYVVLLNRLTKTNDNNDKYSGAIDEIISIIKFFGQLEVKVRINISSSDLFKLLLKSYPKLSSNHQLTILKFIKSMSCVLEILKHLQSADILEFLVLLIKDHSPSTKHYKEFINIICPILYNYCYLNHSKEIELVKLDAVPYLRDLSKINLPFRQFILPILCELVYCNKFVRNNLVKHNILDVYLNLLIDPYWQANSLDSILNWYKHDHVNVILNSPKAINCLTSGFILNKVSNLELALDNYHKLVNVNPSICQFFVKDSIIDNIIQKLKVNLKNSVVQLTILRILKSLLINSNHLNLLVDSFTSIKSILTSLESRKSSLLVDELASEIITILE